VSLEVDVVRERPEVVIAARGEVDLATAPVLRDAVEGADPEASVVVVDLTDVSFLDSSGLRVLAQCQRMLSGPDEDGAAMRVVVASPAVQRVFDVTGLRSFFDVYDSLDDALVGR
jgi:anti-sigma B factor antagonist